MICHGTALLFGVPAFLLFRRLNWTWLWLSVAFGAALGAAAGIFEIVLFLVGPDLEALDRGIEPVPVDASELISHIPAMFLQPITWMGAILGAVVGTTLWLIARPDLQSRQRSQAAREPT